jgi:predicted P-loop ATPase
MSERSEVLREAKRLASYGFALHWLHPKSKRPVGEGWSTRERATYEELKAEYKEGCNLGVRLGEVSSVNDCGLYAIDVDVKGSGHEYEQEALAVVKKILGAHYDFCPQVLSGRGNGSRHYYFLSKSPITGFECARSADVIEVLMPSIKASRKDVAALGEDKCKAGWRQRPAWTVDIMSQGTQTVLPPSTHPDTGRRYVWSTPLAGADDLPIITVDQSLRPKKKSVDTSGFKFKPVEVDVELLGLSDNVMGAIVSGAGVDDRSAYLLTASRALIGAGLTQDEILSVLTDKSNFIGSVGYDHVGADNRNMAAHWVYKYTLARVQSEMSAANLFSEAVEVTTTEVEGDEVKEVESEIKKEVQWADRLQRTKDGAVKSTFYNCRLILTGSTSLACIGRNTFACDDYYLVDTPWGGRAGDPITDVDFVRIKNYCVQHFRAEFSINTVVDAVTSIGDDNRYHPVRNWLASLEWDGVHRLDSWLVEYCGAEGPKDYVAAIGRKFLVAMVKRVYEPGCGFHQVLILEGKQNAGKSSVARVLGSPWFSDAPIVIGDKDAVMSMQSKWVVELGELGSMSKADVEQLKAFISQSVDRIRPSYGRKVMDYPRQSVFIGTTNNHEYLRDATGNRRYWPVKVANTIAWRELERDRAQLFAEARLTYELGESVWLEPELYEVAQKIQATRIITDEWLPLVAKAAENFSGDFYMHELASRLDQVNAQKLDAHTSGRIGRCLRALGYEAYRPRGAVINKWKLQND